MEITFQNAKRKLATLWFVFCGVIFLLLTIQTLLGKFEDFSKEIWSWFLPNIIPTLSLMVSVFAFDIKQKGDSGNRGTSVFYFRLPYFMSIFYLTLLLIVILIQPLTGKSLVDLSVEANLFLAPLQGLVVLLIGFFFVKK